MDYYCDYIDITNYDLTDYDFNEIFNEEDLPKGLFDFCNEYEYVPYDGLLDYDNVAYQDAVFNKFLELFNAELQKEIPELEITQAKSGTDKCKINDEQLLTTYYENTVKKDKSIDKYNNIIDYIIEEKLDVNCRDLAEKAEDAVDKKEYVTIKIESLNEIAKFEPKIESIDEFTSYMFDHVEKTEDDEEMPVYRWIADAPGQQKLDLKYESIAQVSEALEEILKVLR